MLKILPIALILVGASLGAQETSLASTDAVPLDRIVAVVGEQPITRYDIQERILQKQQLGEIRQLPTDSAGMAALETQVLNEMIDDELLLLKAKDLAVVVEDADINNTIDLQIKSIRSRFSTESEFRAELAKAGLGTPEQYRQFLVQQLRRRETIDRTKRALQEAGKIIPSNVTEAEVAAAFEENKQFMPPMPASVTFRQIVINPKPSDTARAAARAKAESLLVDLKSGADFATLAKRESMDPGSKETGGDLGWQRRGVFVPEFDRWLFGPYALRPGDLSPVVETPFGFHIIRVDRAQPAEVKARHILIRPQVDSAQVEKARLEADSVLALWQSGVDFDTLAKAHHDYANKEETTFLTPFPRDSLPAEYQAAFAGEKAGDLTTFQIPSPTGVPKFVVAQLVSEDAGGERTLDDMRTFVRQRLAQQRGLERYLQSLRRETYVSVRLDSPPSQATP